MTSFALTTGLKSLLASQFLLETVGHNIANASTPGYSKQRVQVATALALPRGGLLIGNGVEAVSVQRSIDALLNRRVLAQIGAGGRLESQVAGMSQVEALLADLDGQGIGGLLDGFFSSVGALAASPDDAVLRSGAVQATSALTGRLASLAGDLSSLAHDTTLELGARVDEVNALAKQVLALNLQIAETESAGAPANDLRDQRDVLVERLGKLADATAVEEPSGAVRVLVGGVTIVSSTRTYDLRVEQDPGGTPVVLVQGGAQPVQVTGGKIAGLLQLVETHLPHVGAGLDALARALALETNRAHTTGIPAKGPFQNLTGANRLVDVDQDGELTDELLSKAGLPFDVVGGALHVTVTESETGAVERHRIEISSTHTTVGDLLAELNAIPHLSAEVDAQGRVRVAAAAGYGFDFGRRLDPNPDPSGTFGGGRASLGTAAQGPFALADGDTLDLTVGASSFTITLSAADFADVGEATAEELAAVINADPGAQSAGLAATAVDGRLFVQTLAEGAGASFTVDGGSALAGLGWSAFAGQTVQGHDDAVDVQVSGAYTGAGEGTFTFRPLSDGVVGTTPDLRVEVLDAAGNVVATLDVGAGYAPGEELEVADGVKVSFGLGTLSATHGDLFALDVVADSDTSDVLVALGLNVLLTGSTAADLAVRADLEADPSLLATSGTGAASDNAPLLELLDVQHAALADLDDRSVGDFYADVAGGVAFQLSTGLGALEANETLLASLELMRQQVSGVNVDEETVDMLRYEQAFAASAQFIGVVNSLTEEILSLV